MKAKKKLSQEARAKSQEKTARFSMYGYKKK
jgi:hypothetical protein